MYVGYILSLRCYAVSYVRYVVYLWMCASPHWKLMSDHLPFFRSVCQVRLQCHLLPDVHLRCLNYLLRELLKMSLITFVHK